MIVVRGAQQHNLKHIDITIPRYKLVVLDRCQRQRKIFAGV